MSDELHALPPEIAALLETHLKAFARWSIREREYEREECSREDYLEAVDAEEAARSALETAITALVRDGEAVRRMLETATVRLGILRDRMEGCDEQRRDPSDDLDSGHALSLEEVPAWIGEQRAVLAMPRTTPATHVCGLMGFNPMRGDRCPACAQETQRYNDRRAASTPTPKV